jgi:biopolymer transport protein ExbD
MPKVQTADEGGVGRSRRGRRVTTTLAEINVVPLVDVMLVLLIIFMITAPMMQRGFEVNLPAARRTQTMTGEQLFVTIPLSYRTDRTVRLGDERVRADLLNERVRQALSTRTDKGIYLRGDGGVTLQELIVVFDRLTDGGVDKVGIVAKLPGER